MPIIKTKKTVIYEKCIEGVKCLIIHVKECLCEAKNTDGTYINVVGCIAKVDKASFIFSEDQRKIIPKKYIYLINRSGIPVAMSTMERQCIQITKEDIEQAYIFKYVKAKRYNDKYLCLTMTKDTIIIKDDSEYEILRVMEHVNEINLNQLNYPVVTGDSEDIILQKLRLCFNISLNNQCNIKPDQAFYIIVRITSWGSFNCKVIQLK
uniref:Late endosomal/lysosomal adaptor and MAPK and MTOR activator 5 n=1 Tax=Parastrongyloides trichosuri TaxID=131310 RepID=A0A0N4ZZI7_PARTI